MRQRLPDFIIAGAPRSATTWLYYAADLHPTVAMAKPLQPEPKYFLIDHLYQRGLGHYSQTWFNELPADCLVGEKSTNYMESPVAATRIARDLPNAKIVFLLRNPIDRAYSNYLWSKQNGLETESFERALELETEREQRLKPDWRYARPFSYYSRGLYADLLKPWLALFDRDQLLFLKSEDVATCPRDLVSTFHSFLGVSPCAELADKLGVINSSTRESDETMAPAVRQRLAARYHDSLVLLRNLLGEHFSYS